MTAKDEYMDILWKGLATVTGSLLNTAAKKGLAFTLLIIAVGALIWALFEADARHGRDVRRFEDRLLNFEAKLEMCNKERMEQAVKIARLETVVENLKKKR